MQIRQHLSSFLQIYKFQKQLCMRIKLLFWKHTQKYYNEYLNCLPKKTFVTILTFELKTKQNKTMWRINNLDLDLNKQNLQV